jgi:hypothetical protein
VELYLHSPNTPSWSGVHLKKGERMWREGAVDIFVKETVKNKKSTRLYPKDFGLS